MCVCHLSPLSLSPFVVVVGVSGVSRRQSPLESVRRGVGAGPVVVTLYVLHKNSTVVVVTPCIGVCGDGGPVCVAWKREEEEEW